MALSNIGQNAVEEFFEELMFATAYNEAREQVQNITKDVDNEVVREALESALNVLVMGVVFHLMRKQEDYIERVFNWVTGIAIPIIISSRTKIINRLKRFKGVKLLKRFDFFSKNDNVDVANVVVEMGKMHLQSHQTSSSSSNVFDSVLKQKNYLVNKEKFHLDAGRAFSERYYQTLMFKMFTKTFTSADKEVLKKVLGRSADIDVEDFNKVSDFMFVRDENDNIIGLTEAFVDLINGLGYIHR